MSRERFLYRMRIRLQTEASELDSLVDQIEGEFTICEGNDSADKSNSALQNQTTASLLSASSQTFGKIQLALDRIKDGSYGYCEVCGKVIASQRLEALPYSDKCVVCASADEEANHAL